MTTFNRRSFLKASCAVACASALETGHSVAAVVASRFTRTLPAPLPLSAAEETVLAFVTQHAASTRFVEVNVLAKLRGTPTRETHLLVEIGDAGAFHSALAGPLPFSGGYVAGNVFSFVLGGVEFTVENLTPDAFANRLGELVTLKHIAFAHDSLSYDPATLQLSDPFGAEKQHSLTMVNRTAAGGAAVGLAVRGRVESGRLGMTRGATFTTWQARNLGLGASAKNAQAIVEAFLGKLATISESATSAEFQALLRSRALSTALDRVFGVKVADVIAKFDALRPEISGEFSNAALWLALLLGPELESEAADGAATTWLQRGTRFDILRSRKALAQARALLTSVS